MHPAFTRMERTWESDDVITQSSIERMLAGSLGGGVVLLPGGRCCCQTASFLFLFVTSICYSGISINSCCSNEPYSTSTSTPYFKSNVRRPGTATS